MIDWFEITLLYIIIGGLWAYWLNNYCVKNLEAPYNLPMFEWEIIIHVTLWPLTLSSFLFELIYSMWEEYKSQK